MPDSGCDRGPNLWPGTGVSAAGRQPVEMAGIGATMDRRPWHREVSILIVAGTGVGQCFGCQLRAKVSMMNMRPIMWTWWVSAEPQVCST